MTVQPQAFVASARIWRIQRASWRQEAESISSRRKSLYFHLIKKKRYEGAVIETLPDCQQQKGRAGGPVPFPLRT